MLYSRSGQIGRREYSLIYRKLLNTRCCGLEGHDKSGFKGEKSRNAILNIINFPFLTGQATVQTQSYTTMLTFIFEMSRGVGRESLGLTPAWKNFFLIPDKLRLIAVVQG